MKKRRRGSFTLSRHVLFNEEDARLIFKDVIVWHTESRIDRNEVTYFAEHPDFEPVSEGEITPKYEAVISKGEVEWKRAT